MELNLRMSVERDVRKVIYWFNELWENEDLVVNVKDKVIKYYEKVFLLLFIANDICLHSFESDFKTF